MEEIQSFHPFTSQNVLPNTEVCISVCAQNSQVVIGRGQEIYTFYLEHPDDQNKDIILGKVTSTSAEVTPGSRNQVKSHDADKSSSSSSSSTSSWSLRALHNTINILQQPIEASNAMLAISWLKPNEYVVAGTSHVSVWHLDDSQDLYQPKWALEIETPTPTPTPLPDSDPEEEEEAESRRRSADLQVSPGGEWIATRGILQQDLSNSSSSRAQTEDILLFTCEGDQIRLTHPAPVVSFQFNPRPPPHHCVLMTLDALGTIRLWQHRSHNPNNPNNPNNPPTNSLCQDGLIKTLQTKHLDHLTELSNENNYDELFPSFLSSDDSDPSDDEDQSQASQTPQLSEEEQESKLSEKQEEKEEKEEKRSYLSRYPVQIAQTWVLVHESVHSSDSDPTDPADPATSLAEPTSRYVGCTSL